MIRQGLLVGLSAVLLAACSHTTSRPTAGGGIAATSPSMPAPADTRRGAYYLDDGPGDAPPDLSAIPDAQPVAEPLHRFANNPYSVLGKDYQPLRQVRAFRETGVASWYGRKFHGQKTSSGEAYDMYAMTAAHPTLPIPSYARISANGRSVVVRINDRGPFLHNRIIDLSYTAAWKLGIANQGSGPVVVESILPGTNPPPPVAAETDPIARFAEGVPPPAISPSERGIFLQLGAFGSADNAEALRSRLARNLGPLAERLTIREGENLYRVQLGPWPDLPEARRAADQVASLLEFRPAVVQR